MASLLLAACGGAGASGEPGAAVPAVATAAPAATTEPEPDAGEAELLPPGDPPVGSSQFSTDFSRHTVPYDEILSGGPPKDGIPSIDSPSFTSVADADEWLTPPEPVIFVEINGDARAYPLQILTWHEIVNDEVGGTPVAVTFCPLCNTAIAFEREFAGQVLDFGTTGRLRFSNLIMYDRQTETWWQQGNGAAIAGQYAGERLEFVPAAIIAWQDFKAGHPDGRVLSRETGFSRSYGQNPYTGYDDVDSSPFLYQGPATPGELPPVARVLTVDLNGEAVAYPYQVLEATPVINDEVGGTPIVVFWAAGTASALDTADIAAGRDVGAAIAYDRQVGDQLLSFEQDGTRITDVETGSEWNLLGQALSGPLAGEELQPVVANNHFWFSWAAFRPETQIHQQ